VTSDVVTGDKQCKYS